MEKIKSYLNKNIFENKLGIETLWALISKGSTFILFYLFIIFLSRYLGVELFGKWSFLYSIITIMFVVSFLGINPAVKVYFSKTKNKDDLSYAIFSSFKLRFIGSLIIILLYFVFIIFLYFYKNINYLDLILLALPFIFFKALVEYFRNAFQGLHNIKNVFYINMCEYGLNLIFTILFLMINFSIKSIIYALTLSTIITSILGITLIIKHWNFKRNKIYEKKYLKEIFRYSIPLTFISLGFLLITEIDVLMLGWLTNNIEVGIYSVAKNIVNKLPQIAFAITMGIMPTFSLINEKNKAMLQNRFKKLIFSIFIIYGFITIGLLSISPFLIPILFGSDYFNSVLPLQILSIWIFIVSFNVIFNSFLDFQEKAKKRAIHFSITIILVIILNLLLIPEFGAIGAALGTTISYIPFVLLNWLEVRKTLYASKKNIS